MSVYLDFLSILVAMPTEAGYSMGRYSRSGSFELLLAGNAVNMINSAGVIFFM